MASYQQGGRNGHRDFERNPRNDQRIGQRADQGYRDLGYRTEPRGSRAGGRSEELARQRDAEQLRAGYRREDWQRNEITHNVRSEPHWDPSEWRGGERDRGESYASRASGWPSGGHGNWEDDRYAGSPNYENQRGFGSYEPQRFEGQRGFGERDRYRNAEDARFNYSQQGYGQLRGRGEGSIVQRNDERDIRDAGRWDRSFRNQDDDRDRYHPQEDGLGQQLQDAGRRLIGKVKRIVRNPKNYKRSDERIREDVCDRLALSDEIDPSEIEVTVSNGEVTLTGTVESRHEKFSAEELADEVAGVHDVHNQLRLKRQEGSVANTNSTNATSSAQDVTQRGRNFGRS